MADGRIKDEEGGQEQMRNFKVDFYMAVSKAAVPELTKEDVNVPISYQKLKPGEVPDFSGESYKVLVFDGTFLLAAFAMTKTKMMQIIFIGAPEKAASYMDKIDEIWPITDKEDIYRAIQKKTVERLKDKFQAYENEGIVMDSLIKNLPMPIVSCDNEYRMQMANDTFLNMTQTKREELAHMNYLQWRGDRMEPVGSPVKNEKSHTVRQDFRLVRGPVTRYITIVEQRIIDQEGGPRGYFCLFLDSTTQKIYEKSIRQEANSDELTGLFNRRYFNEYLNRNWGKPMTMLYMDLDKFKTINDTMGHDVGDEVLKKTSEFIAKIFSDGISARLGGDEFAVVFIGPVDIDGIKVKCEKLSEAMMARFTDGAMKDLGFSIGIATTDGKDKDVETFMREADLHMYEKKKQHHGSTDER